MGNYKIDASNRILFSKDMKIVELLDVSCELLSVFLRLDMQLPFGDLSVEELCRRYSLSSEMFLMLCRVYAGADMHPAVDNLQREDLRHIVGYLRASHRYYAEQLLPSIEQGVERVLSMCEKRQSDIVRKFYDDYADEVHAHLQYEEQVIFPYVEQLLLGEKHTEGMAVKMSSHTDICDKVDDIKSIIIKYLPASCPTAERCGVLRDLAHLRDDLAKHTLIETAVLTPMVVALENQ